MLLRCLAHRTLLGVMFASCLLFILVSFLSFPLQLHPLQWKRPSNTATTEYAKLKNPCNTFPTPPDTLVIVKTGANEIYDKLPIQLLTMLQCYQDLLIFSDMEQRIGHYPVHDALDNFTEAIKLHNPDFDYYRTLQEYKRNRQDISTLRTDTGDAAWRLDKYKFLHMLEKTWKMRPFQKWYIFIEADTYLVRSNLLLWLERLDPSQPLYMGSPTYAGDGAFAHGGSGFVLSGAAMSKFAEGDPGVASRYDELIENETFGDYILMKALRDKGVELSKRWPMLQAEKPASIPFGPGPDNGVRHWCQPIVTMHHISPDEVSRLWEFEQQRVNVKVRFCWTVLRYWSKRLKSITGSPTPARALPEFRRAGRPCRERRLVQLI